MLPKHHDLIRGTEAMDALERDIGAFMKRRSTLEQDDGQRLQDLSGRLHDVSRRINTHLDMQGWKAELPEQQAFENKQTPPRIGWLDRHIHHVQPLAARISKSLRPGTK